MATHLQQETGPIFGRIPAECTSCREFTEEWRSKRSPRTGQVRLLLNGCRPGSVSALSEPEMVELARLELEAHAALLEVDSSSLHFEELKEIRIQGRPVRFAAVFHQEVDGWRIDDGYCSVIMDRQGRIAAISSHAHTGAGLQVPPVLLASEEAKSICIDRLEGQFGRGELTVETALVVLGNHLVEGAMPVPAWRVVLRSEVDWGWPIAMEFLVRADSHSARIIGERNLVKGCSSRTHSEPAPELTTGFVQANVTDSQTNLPDDLGGIFPAGSGTSVERMPFIRVVDGSTTFADAAGNFISPILGPVDTDVLMSTDSQRTQVNVPNSGGSSTYSETFLGFTGGAITLNSGLSENETAACNAYYAAHRFRDFPRQYGDFTLDSQDIDLFVSDSSIPLGNAVYDGGSEINFAASGVNAAGTRIANMAYSTVVGHEMGHWANIIYGRAGTIGNSGMDEAFADVWAMYIFGTEYVAENYAGFGTFVRSGNNTEQKCFDGQDCTGGDPHVNGLPLMGALWKVRVGVGASLAEDLFLTFMGNSTAMPAAGVDDILRDWWLILDDDDMDLGTLTPNFNAINDAFLDHGWPEFGVNAVEMAHDPLPDSPVDQPLGVTISAQLSVIPEFQGAVTGLNPRVIWSAGGSSQPPATMVAVGGGTYEAALNPGGGGFVGPDTLDYFIEVSYSVGGFARSIRLPEEGSFHVTFGTLVPLFKSDFESTSSLGWTHTENSPGLTDDWQHGYGGGKQGVDAGLLWTDPRTDNSDPVGRIWGTDLGGTGWNGEYNISTDSYLLSPVIKNLYGSTDLSIRFSRWLTKSVNATASISLVDPSSGSSLSVWTSPSAAFADSNWIQVEYPVTLPPGVSEFQIRFELEGGLIANAGGWNINDLEVFYLGTGSGSVNTLMLTGNTEIAVGESPVFKVENASSGDNVRLYYSTAYDNTAPGYPDLTLTPVEVAASPQVANSQGEAFFNLAPVGSGASGMTVYFEAGVLGSGAKDSNLLPVTVHP